MSDEPTETFRYTNPFGHEEYRVTVKAQANGWTSFEAWAAYGGEGHGDDNYAQFASLGLKDAEALRLAQWIIANVKSPQT